MAFAEARLDIVLHLAAQPLVCSSYREPTLSFKTNVWARRISSTQC